MAKKSEAPKSTSVATAPSPEPGPRPSSAQIKSAITCICAITGCGRLEAEARIKKMPDAQVIRLAELEQAKRRREAIPILYS